MGFLHKPLEMVNRRDQGLKAESRVQKFLETSGFKFYCRNFRWKGGEVDLVMEDPNGTLVFVEVRSSTKESPWLRYSIQRAKRRRMMATTHEFFLRNPKMRIKPFRFDLVWVEQIKIEHWKNITL